MKKKLDEKISSESVLNMSNFGLRFAGLGRKNKHLISSSKIAKLAKGSRRQKQAVTSSDTHQISQERSQLSSTHTASQSQGSRSSSRHHSASSSSSCFTIAFPATSAAASSSAAAAAAAATPSFCSSSSSVNSSLSSVSSTVIQTAAKPYTTSTGSNRYSYSASNSSFSNPSLSPDITLTLATPDSCHTPDAIHTILPIDAVVLSTTAVVAPRIHEPENNAARFTNLSNNYKNNQNNNVIPAVRSTITQSGKRQKQEMSCSSDNRFYQRFRRSSETSDNTGVIFSQSQQHFTTAEQINNSYNQSFHVNHENKCNRTRPQSLTIECHDQRVDQRKERSISIIPCSNRKIIDHQSILLQLCKSMHVVSTTDSVSQTCQSRTDTHLTQSVTLSSITDADLSSPDDSISTVRTSPDSVIQPNASVEQQPKSLPSPLRKSPLATIDYDEFDRIDSLEWDEPVMLKKMTSLPTEEALVRHCQAVVADGHSNVPLKADHSLNACGLHRNPCLTCLKFTLRVLTGCCLGVFAP